jgi:hypothetical protein
MTTTLANQLPRINLANGGSMPSAQVVTLQSGQQNASSVDSKSPCTHLSFVQAQHYRLNTTALLSSHRQTGSYVFTFSGELRLRCPEVGFGAVATYQVTSSPRLSFTAWPSFCLQPRYLSVV